VNLWIDQRVIKLELGEHHVLVLTQQPARNPQASEQGYAVYSWGENFDGQLGVATCGRSIQSPTLIEGLSNKAIVDISAGKNSNLALTADGRLFMWGSGADGILGKDLDMATEPIRVQLRSHKLIQAKFGFRFVVALTRKGQLLSWGANDLGM
jgi:alpha-tubulin suppressor-like RCC1 family protein